MYQYVSYPKWLYHPSKEPVIVRDEAAHLALGPEWAESPALVAVAKPAPKPPEKPSNGATGPAKPTKVK